MPHECFERVFFECDPSIAILEVMIEHMEAANRYNEEEEDYSDWLISSTLIHGAENCSRYLLTRDNLFISQNMVLSSIMGGNIGLFDLVYRMYNSPINFNHMF